VEILLSAWGTAAVGKTRSGVGMGFLLQLLKSSKKALGEKRTASLDADGTSSLHIVKTVKSTFLDFIDECRREYLQQSTMLTTGSTNEEKDSCQQSSPNSQGSTSAGSSPALDSLSECSTSPVCPSTSSFCSIAEAEGRDLPSPGLASTEQRLSLEAREISASNQDIQTQSSAKEGNAVDHGYGLETRQTRADVENVKVRQPKLPFSSLLSEALKATAVDARARKQRVTKRPEVAASTSPQKRLRFTASEGLVRSL
jgi:hypothetical protein